jgi:hypothetical protein
MFPISTFHDVLMVDFDYQNFLRYRYRDARKECPQQMNNEKQIQVI